VRDRLTQEIAAQLTPRLGGRATPDQIEEASRAALEDPRLRDTIENSIIVFHRQMLGKSEGESTSVDATAVASAAQQSLIAQHPELAGKLPVVPPLVIRPPITHVPDLSGPRDILQRVVPLLAILAALLFALSFAVTGDRPWVLRRLGWWALATGLGWFAVGAIVPHLVGTVAPGAEVSVASIIGALLGAVLTASTGLVIFGFCAVVAGHLWKNAARRGGSSKAASPPGARPPAVTGFQKRNYYERQSRSVWAEPKKPEPRGPGRRWSE
jgi:hypothetical protein